MDSVYAEPMERACRSLYRQFPVALQLETLSIRLEDDLRLGKRYGYLGPPTAMINGDPVYGDSRRYARARGALEGSAFIFPLIIAKAYRSEAEVMALVAGEMLNIHNGVAYLNKLVECEGIYLKPLTVSGDLNTLYKQSLKPPNPWVVKLTGEIVMPVSLYKSPDTGEHQLPPTTGQWIKTS